MTLRSAASFPAIAALASAARAQALGGQGAPDVSLVRVFLALLFCLIVAALAILFAKYRLGGGMPPLITRMNARDGRIRLVETRRIGPQSELSVVECDGEEYLLLLSPGGPLLLRSGKARGGGK